ncbi:MAG: monofunctional biosynthetic peptidoglycan transglycosylase [Rhodothermales bacterium]|nr:monofunctional biosynthetic peptidoglycan transglycosylase [Rhodothermales bacterium]
MSRHRKIFRRFIVSAGILLLAILGVSILVTLPLRWLNPQSSAFMVRSSVPVMQEWVDIEHISAWMPIAVVASEDQKFPTHGGFDFESIQDAMNDSEGPRRGASTISQQVAKNLYLWPGKSFFRKGVEAYLTVLLETFLSKRRILEIYLNIAEFGEGVYGVEAAARAHFSKSAGSLSRHEAARLAAVLPNPRLMSASRPSRYVVHRTSSIERAIGYLGGPSFLDNILQ